jgi:hypothetical protein
MKFGIKVDGRLLAVDLQKNLDKQVERAVELMAQDAIAVINQRTVSGKDADEKSFVNYSKEYAKIRTDNGRQTKPVDLLWTGGMLRSMQYKTKEDGANMVAEIFFNDATEADKAAGLMKGVRRKDGKDSARKFFAFGEKLINRLTKIYGKSINFKEANK